MFVASDYEGINVSCLFDISTHTHTLSLAHVVKMANAFASPEQMHSHSVAARRTTCSHHTAVVNV